MNDSYETPKTQIVRQFQNLGVQLANPMDYVARYGTQLQDAQTLVSHARQVGVVEDIVINILMIKNNNNHLCFFHLVTTG